MTAVAPRRPSVVHRAPSAGAAACDVENIAADLAYARAGWRAVLSRHAHDRAHLESGDIALTNRALIAAIAVLGIGLAGCGSSKTTSSSSTPAFKAAFVADRTQFRQLGNSLAKALTGAGSKTDDQLATQFQGLAVKAKDATDEQFAAFLPLIAESAGDIATW